MGVLRNYLLLVIGTSLMAILAVQGAAGMMEHIIQEVILPPLSALEGALN